MTKPNRDILIAQRMEKDGWTFDPSAQVFTRTEHDSVLRLEDMSPHRYATRLPTNRRRKRERCQANRRERRAEAERKRKLREAVSSR